MKVTMNRLMVAGFVAMTLGSCANESKTDTGTEPVKVKTVTVETSAVDGGRKYSGTIEEDKGTEVSFATAGTVRQVLVNNGQRVSKGQLIATLDATTLQNAHNATVSVLHQAEDAYQRMKKLHDSNSISEMQWVEVQSKVEQARSSEQMARRALSDVRLVAPASGIITSKNVESGQNVMPGLTVMRIVDIDRVKVNISVPENEVSSIANGTNVNVSVPAVSGHFTGMITEKNVTANALSRTYNIKATVNNAAHKLMPGMICEVDLPLPLQGMGEKSHDSASGVIVLPIDAVQLSEKNFYFVWTTLHGKAHKTYVEVGSVTSTGVTITNGLSAGDQVIVEGQQKVSEGMALREVKE